MAIRKLQADGHEMEFIKSKTLNSPKAYEHESKTFKSILARNLLHDL